METVGANHPWGSSRGALVRLVSSSARTRRSAGPYALPARLARQEHARIERTLIAEGAGRAREREAAERCQGGEYAADL